MNTTCLNCLVSKRLYDYPSDASETQKYKYMRGVIDILSNSPDYVSAPVISEKIYSLYKKVFGKVKDFSTEKTKFNRLVLNIKDELNGKIHNSCDPFLTALQFCVVGNYIDYSTVKDVNENKLLELIDNASTEQIKSAETENLRKDVLNAKNIVYVCDNCGEIVIDKLFMDLITELNKSANITVIVRGKPVSNDATKKDLAGLGFEKYNVIDNGCAIPGIFMEQMSKTVAKALKNADVIIAKGQGNFETMQQSKLNIYYLFMCKCKMFEEKFNVSRFAKMILNEKRIY